MIVGDRNIVGSIGVARCRSSRDDNFLIIIKKLDSSI